VDINEILAKPQSEWSLEESVFVDYIYSLTSQNGSQIPPNQTMPSGRFLHNPAQKTIKSADKWATEQIDGAKNNAEKWKTNIATPSRDPIKSAIDAEDKWKNNLTKAMNSGKWERNLGKKTLADITATVNALGSTVFSQGVAARETKIRSKVGELQPKIQAVSNAIQALPNATEGDRDNRVLQNVKLMRKIGEG